MSEMGRPKTSTEKAIKKFKSEIVKSECWTWNKNTSGRYGCVYLGNGKSVSAHVLAYKIWIGKVPKGRCVLHKCDNKECVKPAHLFLGTKQDNINDAWEKKRLRFGEIHHHAKMSDSQVDSCRLNWKSTRDTRSLANKYGVHKTTIQRIVGLKTRTIPTSQTIFAKQLFSKASK